MVVSRYGLLLTPAALALLVVATDDAQGTPAAQARRPAQARATGKPSFSPHTPTPARQRVGSGDLVVDHQATTLSFDKRSRRLEVKTRWKLRAVRALNSPQLVIWIGGLAKPSISVGGPGVGRVFGPWSDGTRSVVLFRLWKRLARGETLELVARSSGAARCRSRLQLGSPDPRHCIYKRNAIFKGHWAWQHVLRRAYREHLFPARSSLEVIASAHGGATRHKSTVVATGLDTRPTGAGQPARWTNSGAQGSALVIAPFRRAEQRLGGTRVRVHLLSAAAHARAWAALAAEMVDFFSKLYGPYPYDKLDVVELPGRACNVAFSTFTTVFVPRRFLQGDPRLRSPLTLAHEIAHQWFGSSLVKNARGAPYWLAEGMAWHAALLFDARRAKASAAAPVSEAKMATYRRRLSRAYRYGVEEAKRDLPLHGTRGHQTVADIVSYHKGALLLELLRWRLSDATFFAGLSRYVRTHKTRPGTLGGLIAALSAAAGEDLTSLFADWNLGYPTYRVGVRRAGKLTRISVRADRLAHVELPLVLHLADGRRELHRLPINARSVSVEHRGARVVAVSLDPGHRIPRVVRGALAGDVVIDGEVDARDVLAIGASLDRRRSFDRFDERADLVRDGRIDHRDVAAVLAQLGRSAQGRWYRERLCSWLAPGLPGCPTR